MPAYPQFFAVLAALRQALTLLPWIANGPDLPDQANRSELPGPVSASAAVPLLRCSSLPKRR
jgi:hypothetical protein